MTTLTLYSPAGIVAKAAVLRRAAKRLTARGLDVNVDESALARHHRFAGEDDARLAAIHRVADAAPSIAMAARGGYGLTRLLDRIDWKKLDKSVQRGTRWVGHSDVTALQLGLLAHKGAPSWAGPMGCFDFGGDTTDDVTVDCFFEAMGGELEAVGFRTEAGFDGLERRGVLWGGNLEMVISLLGTPHFPQVKGGILFVEDVNVHPYRIERCMLQLKQAGVLDRQKAVLFGQFTEWKPSPLDHGYGMKAMVAKLRSVTDVPILTGLPFGHVPTKLTMPVGAKVTLLVDGRQVLVGW
jgi:muramoyltetrapeptide carboxypeptidase